MQKLCFQDNVFYSDCYEKSFKNMIIRKSSFSCCAVCVSKNLFGFFCFFENSSAVKSVVLLDIL